MIPAIVTPTLLLSIGLSYAVIGLVLAAIYRFVLRRRFIGDFPLAVVVAIVASFAGGLLEFLLKDVIEALSSINGMLNIFPPLAIAAMALSAFAAASERKGPYD